MSENKAPETLTAEQTEKEKEKEKKPMDLQSKVLGDFTQYDISTIRQSIASGLTTPEFNLYINTAASAGLNPFLGHIVPVIFSADNPDKRKLNIQVAVEGIEHLARQKEGWQGIETQLICEKDTFKAKRDKETGRWMIEEHEISFPRGRTIAAYSIARRKGFEDVYIFMEVSEVEHLKSGYATKSMWGTWFNDMFKKHIKKRALREQFGIELDDIENAAGGPTDYGDSNLENYKPSERKEIRQEEPEPDHNQELNKLLDEMTRLQKQYGLSADDVNDIKKRRLSLEPEEAGNFQQIAALKRFLELEGPTIQKERKERKEAAQKDIKQAAAATKVNLESAPTPEAEPPVFENGNGEPDEIEEMESFFNEGRLV